MDFISNIGLYQRWLDAKEVERVAVEERRLIEDKLVSVYGIAQDAEGSSTFLEDGYKVVVTNRITRKVDSDKVQQIAQEFGLADHVYSLFRWKAEINAKMWQSTDSSITTPFIDAITAKPGRPSFSIQIQKENDNEI